MGAGRNGTRVRRTRGLKSPRYGTWLHWSYRARAGWKRRATVSGCNGRTGHGRAESPRHGECVGGRIAHGVHWGSPCQDDAGWTWDDAGLRFEGMACL